MGQSRMELPESDGRGLRMAGRADRPMVGNDQLGIGIRKGSEAISYWKSAEEGKRKAPDKFLPFERRNHALAQQPD